MRKLCIIILSLILILIPGCAKSQSGIKSEQAVAISDDKSVILGAETVGHNYSVNEYGIFFLENSRMQFYDFSTNNSYVLCDKVNCRHADDSCSAWYESEFQVKGMAFVNGMIYVMKLNSNQNSYDLIEMDITGNNLKVIYSLDIGDYKDNSWVVNFVEDSVIYAKDIAWINVSWEYVVNKEESRTRNQCLGISLKNGSVVESTELVDEDIEYFYETVSDDGVILCKTWDELSLLSEAEFYEEYEKNGFQGAITDEEDPYWEYVSVWYENNRKPMYAYYKYDIDSGEMQEFASDKRTKYYGADETTVGYAPEFSFLGAYQGRYLCQKNDYASDNSTEEVFLWDIDSGERESVLTIENGGTLATKGAGTAKFYIFDEHTFFYCLYVDEDNADVYSFDLESMQNKKLYQDARNIDYRIVDDITNTFIMNVGEDENLYTLDKSDYYAGKVENSSRIKW